MDVDGKGATRMLRYLKKHASDAYIALIVYAIVCPIMQELLGGVTRRLPHLLDLVTGLLENIFMYGMDEMPELAVGALLLLLLEAVLIWNAGRSTHRTLADAGRWSLLVYIVGDMLYAVRNPLLVYNDNSPVWQIVMDLLLAATVMLQTRLFDRHIDAETDAATQ